jgi:hypothetical protein
MKVLVGSQALNYWGLSKRKPRDTDYFSDEPIDGAETFYHPALKNWEWGAITIATPEELRTIKISHIFWELQNNSWDKHWFDIMTLQQADAEFLPELYDILYPIWEKRYGKKKVNLNADPKDFFNSNVVRKYEHDSIHASVAYYDEPLFNRVLKDGHAVMVDWSKFEALDYEDKLRLVREEVYATALERQVIPSNYKVHPRVAYKWALMKTLTSFWKGKWALFIALNALELNKPEHDYVKYHLANKSKLILNEEVA